MTYDVTSLFAALIAQQAPVLDRRFYIGDSDYTSRVTKFPIASQVWNDVKPQTFNASLSNEDGGMQFLQIDKTLLTSECKVSLVYTHAPPTFIIDDITTFVGDRNAGINFPAAYGYSHDGTRGYIVEDSLPRYIREYYCPTPFNIYTSSYMGTAFAVYSLTGAALGKARGVTCSGNKKRMLINFDSGVVGFLMNSDYLTQSMSMVGSYGWGHSISRGVDVNSAGTGMYITSSKQVHKYTLGGDCNPTSVTSHSFMTNSYAVASGGWLNDVVVLPNESRIFTCYHDNIGAVIYSRVHQYDLTVAGTLTNYTVNSVNHRVNLGAASTEGFAFDKLYGRYLSILTTNISEVKTYSVDYPNNNEEEMILISGTIDTVVYKGGLCDLRIADKMQQLSERLVGTQETPVTFTNTLVSDVAWALVTSYGGYQVTKSTANVDIDYTSWVDWDTVMTGDSVKVSAEFTGKKVTDCLRTIARMTKTAIYIEENKLKFNRFSDIVEPDLTIDNTTILDSVLSIKHYDVVNKQYVHAGYDIDSDYYTIVVHDQLSASVNSFGLHEQIFEDSSIWFVDSTSALTLAQRSTFTDGEPLDRITVKTPLNTLVQQVGDTIYYVNSQHGVEENYKIMSKKLDINKSTITLDIDRSQLVDPFILDVTSLDGTEVLT